MFNKAQSNLLYILLFIAFQKYSFNSVKLISILYMIKSVSINLHYAYLINSFIYTMFYFTLIIYNYLILYQI